MIQTVILTGGPGTRLGSISKKVPKAMLRIEGKPFLELQLELLRSNGLRDIVLCVGYLAEQIFEYFGDGSKFGLSIQYSREKDILLGTGGALKFAEDSLDDPFLVLCGDVFFLIDYRELIKRYSAIDRKVLVAVRAGDKRIDPPVRDLGDLRSAHSIFRPSSHKYKCLVYGVAVCSKNILRGIPDESSYALDDLFFELMQQGDLEFYESEAPYYGIGSLTGLLQLREALTKNEKIKVTG